MCIMLFAGDDMYRSAAIKADGFFGASVKWISVIAANRLGSVRSAIGTL